MVQAYTSAMPHSATGHAEHRWPVVITTLVAFAIYLLLPTKVQFLPSWVLPVVGIVAIVPLLFMNPHRLNRETTWSKVLSILFAIGLLAVNQVYVVRIVSLLVDGRVEGPVVLLTVLAVWVTNAIAYAIVFWEMDSGGPVVRWVDPDRAAARQDFLFPQQTRQDPWRPEFFDYVFFSLSTMMAFSPTDVMPLSRRAKALMALESLTGFVLLALVISRAVNILAPSAVG